MAPSIPLVAALLRLSNAEMDESSMLQMLMPLTDSNKDECRCPGYYQEECEAEAAQGCRWSDAGSTNKPWCQCLADPVAVPVAPVTLPPAVVDPVTLPPAVSATHYLAVTSWPHDHWGTWSSETRNSPIEVCLAKDQTEETDGSGYLFTSCCDSDGSGMSRDCDTTRNTNFETATAQCASQGGRLCSAEEAMSPNTFQTTYVTASQGCSVDGPSSATGSDLNRLWTSTPCTPEVVPTDPVGEPNVNYNLAHQGHCASGWISGHNTLQADIEACHAHCSANADCGYLFSLRTCKHPSRRIVPCTLLAVAVMMIPTSIITMHTSCLTGHARHSVHLPRTALKIRVTMTSIADGTICKDAVNATITAAGLEALAVVVIRQ